MLTRVLVGVRDALLLGTVLISFVPLLALVIAVLTLILTPMAGCQTPASPAGGSHLACASEAAEDALAASDIPEAAALEYVKERSDCRTHNARLLGR